MNKKSNRRKKRREILTKEERARLFAVLPEKLRLMFEVLNGSGLRVGELRRL